MPRNLLYTFTVYAHHSHRAQETMLEEEKG